MARMLGNARYREIDPRDDTWHGDGKGARRFQRHRERGEFARSLAPVTDLDWLVSLQPSLYDLSDCRHGCNGDCEKWGGEVCDFTCHPPLPCEGDCGRLTSDWRGEGWFCSDECVKAWITGLASQPEFR